MSKEENKKLFDERLKRMQDAAALKEPDRVPILEPGTNTFPYHDAGYTMAEILYDTEKTKDAIRKYLLKYEIDSGHTFAACFEGMGPMLEKSKSKVFEWAGMPGSILDKNSIHQFKEFPTLLENEFHELLTDQSLFTATKYLPRTFGVFEPMANLNIANSLTFGAFNYLDIANFFARPEVRDMITDLVELSGMWSKYLGELMAFGAEVEEMGFPLVAGSPNLASFDIFSDVLRGTEGASYDLYDRPDEVYEYLCERNKRTIANLKAGPAQPGRFVFIPMHKGMDGFLSDDQYRRFYWEHLYQVILAIIDIDMIPYVYTEGKYTTRMEYLKDLPKGKTVVHFEDVDMALAKKELKDVACITGKYPAYLLYSGTKEEVVDEAKKLLDVCAPGGGFIFDFDGGMYESKRENVEALFDTIKTYGKY